MESMMWSDFQYKLYELQSSLKVMVRRTWWLDLDPVIELKYYLKGEAAEALEGLQEKLELIMEMAQRALEEGKEWAEMFIAEIREILGLGRGYQASMAGGELEMVDMGGEHCPTE